MRRLCLRGSGPDAALAEALRGAGWQVEAEAIAGEAVVWTVGAERDPTREPAMTALARNVQPSAVILVAARDSDGSIAGEVQRLARLLAPATRVCAVTLEPALELPATRAVDPAAVAAAIVYLAGAGAVTGQLLALGS